MDNYKYIKVKVLRADDEEHKFIIEWEGKIYKITQLAFQRRLPLPDFLDCKLLTTSSGKIFISQNIDILMILHLTLGVRAALILVSRSIIAVKPY